jgi:hypothetical protein
MPALKQAAPENKGAALAGLPVQLPADHCKCGGSTAIIDSGNLLRCSSCGRKRGWLSRLTADWLQATVALWGKPSKPIIMRGPWQ